VWPAPESSKGYLSDVHCTSLQRNCCEEISSQVQFFNKPKTQGGKQDVTALRKSADKSVLEGKLPGKSHLGRQQGQKIPGLK
jgi:hypothetical protein